MVETTDIGQVVRTERHIKEFERFESQSKAPSWMFPLRKAGIARFAELGFPTTSEEDWRFTNVAPIADLPFKPALESARQKLDPGQVGAFVLADLEAIQLVFINGHFTPALSQGPSLPPGAIVTSLAQALESNLPGLEEHLARHANLDRQAFTALNTAFIQDGAFIHLPKNFALEVPVHLMFISTAKEPGTACSPRNLILAEDGSQATILESYHCTRSASYLTNAVTELVVGNNARLEHCKFQDESTLAYHVAATHARVGRDSNVIWHSISTGARLARNNINAVLSGEGLECTLNGLYLTRGDQLADHHMVVEHVEPRCASHEYFNGIMDGHSKGVFHGRILVKPAAQKTDAKQTNKNLLLSDDATIDTKPQLEIYADDVKCTHGATVGQLNEDSIFYLRARGIGTETARRMLIHAFAGEIIERIRHRPLRDALDKIVWDRLEANPHVGEHK